MTQSVLIVEYDPVVLDELSLYVKDSEFRVQCATHIEAAMSKLRNHRLPIAIVDWDLPNDEASELIKQIRANHRLRRTHILALSAFSSPAVTEAAMNAGADDFFSKPIGAGELRARLLWAGSRAQAIV